MKKTGIIASIIVILLIFLYFFSTDAVDHTPYFESNYFRQAIIKIDSLKRNNHIISAPVHAGFAKVSITPGLNNRSGKPDKGEFMQIPLAGYGARKGAPAVGIHDSIYIKAAALKVNNDTVIFISGDLLIIPYNITDSAMILLSKKGFRRDQLFFASTHTHSSLGAWGGGYIGSLFAGKENKDLGKWLAQKIYEAVIIAANDLKPAKIGSGNFNAGSFTKNRLIGDLGITNEDFSIICIEQKNYKKAVIGSFLAHATTLGAENMEISGDYPGYWAREMENTSVDLALFFAGSMGSQSPVSRGKGFDKAKYLGESLADSTVKYLQKAVYKDTISFSKVTLEMPLPGYHLRLTRRINLSSSISNRLMPKPESVFLQAVRTDDMVWITTPADFSGEYAVQIKNSLALKGFESNVTGFNGSYVGYIIPGRYFYLNEYEPKTMGWFGPNMGDYTMYLIRRISGIVTDMAD